MRTTALEEHYATTEFLRGPGSWLASRAGVIEPISELGDGRMAAMDEAGVDLAVLSLAAPGVEQLDGPEAVRLARACNDELAAAVRRYPDRLAGFAALPISAPDAAAEELDRAVRELGFPGAVINGHCQGRYLDNPYFDPVRPRGRAQSSHLPAPHDPAGGRYRVLLCGTCRKGHVRAGHGGLGLAHQYSHAFAVHDSRWRIRPPPGVANHHRPHGRSDVVNAAAFSTDYPFGSMRAARTFLDKLALTHADRERISHRNAENLLGL